MIINFLGAIIAPRLINDRNKLDAWAILYLISIVALLLIGLVVVITKAGLFTF